VAGGDRRGRTEPAERLGGLAKRLPKLARLVPASAYMGHSSIQVTYDKYGHLMPGNEDQAAELLDAYLTRARGNAG
jgi:integrase